MLTVLTAPYRRVRRPAGSRLHVRRGAILAVLMACAGLALVSRAEASTQVLALVPSLPALLDNIRNFLMGILASAAIVVFTVGGVRYLFANGDPGEVEKAKSCFRNAGYGVVLAAIAPIIVDILRGLVGV